MKQVSHCASLTLLTGVATLIEGCSTVGTSPEVSIANTGFHSSSAPAEGTKTIDYAASLFSTALYESAKDSGEKSKAEAAFRSGQALLDIRCSKYLDGLGSANQSAANERKQVGIIGGLASAVMGLANTDAKSIAITASTFSFAGSSMDAFANSLLFSDASKSITKLVHSAQAAYLSAAQERIANLNYPNSVSLLIGYEQVCRPAQIRALIDEAISTAIIVSETPVNAASEREVLDVLGQLMGVLGKPISEVDAIGLYAWFSSDTAGRTAIKPKNAVVNSFITSLGSDAALEAKLSPVFLRLSIKGSALLERWATAVAQVKGDVAPPANPQPAALFSVPVLRVETK